MNRLVLTTLLLALAAPASALDFHVDGASGLDTRDGLTWAGSVATIGRALEYARNLPGADTIHVAQGTYVENILVDDSDMTLLGGYPPGGGARDPVLHPTILDGGARGPAVVVSGRDGTLVLTNVAIDGFTMRNGRSFQRGGYAFGGGGVFIEEAQVALTNNVITGNVADGVGAKGGGVYVYRSGAPGSLLRDNQIIANTVPDGLGGGISIVDEGDSAALGAIVVQRNEILSNEATAVSDLDPAIDYEPNGVGGGLYVQHGGARIDGNVFRSNRALATTDIPSSGDGGALMVVEAEPVITGNVMESNQAIGADGAYQGVGGAVYVLSSSAIVDGNQITGNTASGDGWDEQGLGGGVNVTLLQPSDTVLSNNVIGDNDALGLYGGSGAGGGVYAFLLPDVNVRLRVEGGTVETNQAPYAGGGMYLYGVGQSCGPSTGAEDCMNGLDDDGDRLIDCSDTDCPDNGSSIVVDGTHVRANEADFASGVMALGTFTLRNVRIRENAVYDPDGDLVSEMRDNCPGLSNPVQADADADGVGDDCDADDDDDGVADGSDNCRLVDNPGQADANRNGQGDACEGDMDADTWPDAVDNCPQVANAGQEDATFDGVGDACEPAAFDPLETNASGIWLAGDSTLQNAEITDNVGQGIEVVGFAADPGPDTRWGTSDDIPEDPATALITNATISGNQAVGFITYLATSTRWRDSIIAGNVWSDGFDTQDGGGNPSSPAMRFDSVDFGDGVASIPGSGSGNIAASPRFTPGPLGSYYLSQVAAGQALASPCVDAGSRAAAGSVVDGLTTRTDAGPDSGTLDMGFHYPTSAVAPGGDPLADDVDVTGSASGPVISVPTAPATIANVRVYRGSIGALRAQYSHVSPFSGQAGDPECSMAAGASFTDTNGYRDGNDYYYLVVPLNGSAEGSFGTRSNGAPRTRPEDSPTDLVTNGCP